MKPSPSAAKSKKPQAHAASVQSRYVKVLHESETIYSGDFELPRVTQQGIEEMNNEYPGILEQVLEQMGIKKKGTKKALLELELAHERMECATMLKEIVGTRELPRLTFFIYKIQPVTKKATNQKPTYYEGDDPVIIFRRKHPDLSNTHPTIYLLELELLAGRTKEIIGKSLVAVWKITGGKKYCARLSIKAQKSPLDKQIKKLLGLKEELFWLKHRSELIH